MNKLKEKNIITRPQDKNALFILHILTGFLSVYVFYAIFRFIFMIFIILDTITDKDILTNKELYTYLLLTGFTTIVIIYLVKLFTNLLFAHLKSIEKVKAYYNQTKV